MSRQIVEGVLDRYPTLLLVPKDQFEMRRRGFLPHIAQALPGGTARWGALRKSSVKMANDVVVDRTDDQHYDVLTGKNHDDDPSVPEGHLRIEAVWENQGPIKTPNHPDWRWMSIEEANIDPLPDDENGEPPPPPPPPDHDDLAAKVSALEKHIAVLGERLQAASDAADALSIRQGTYEKAQRELNTRVEVLEHPAHPEEFEITIDGETDSTGPRFLSHKHPVHLTGKARKV